MSSAGTSWWESVCAAPVSYFITLDVCDNHTQLRYGVPLWPLRPYSLVLKPYSITLLLPCADTLATAISPCADALTTAISPCPDALATAISPASPSFCQPWEHCESLSLTFILKRNFRITRLSHSHSASFYKRFQFLQVSYTYVLCIGHAISLQLPVPSTIVPAPCVPLLFNSSLDMVWGLAGRTCLLLQWTWIHFPAPHYGSQLSVSSKGFNIIFWSLKVLHAYSTHAYM